MRPTHAQEKDWSLRAGAERILVGARKGLVGRDGVLSIDGLDAAVRTFGVGTVLALSLLGYGKAGGHFSDGLADPVGVAFGLVLYNMLVILILGVPFRRPPSFALFVVDWLMVTTSVLLTGGLLSPFIILYYALGIGAALRVGFSRSMVLVGACSILYALLGLLTDADLGAARLPIAVIEIASLFMVVLTGVGMRNALEVEARRVQLEEQSAQQLRLLNSLINTVLSASPDLEEVMRTVASVSSQALQSDSGLAVLFNDQVPLPASTASTPGQDAALLVSNRNPDPPQLSPIEADLLSRAVATLAPVVLSATEPQRPLRHFPGLERDGAQLCSLVCVPFVLEGRPIGGLFVGRFDQRHFTPAETGLLMAISSQVAVAVRLARLYEMEREKAVRSEERERLERDLLSMVSHELRTPLTAIKTCIGALSDMSPAPEAAGATEAKLLQNIERSTERLIGLVNELLDMARLRAGRVSLQMQQLHAGSLITDLVSQLAPLAEGHGQTLVLDLPPVNSERWNRLNVAGDRRRLEQVLINLVSNANKFSPPQSKIIVGATPRDGQVRIFVRDEGPGVPRHEQTRVFDKFYSGSTHSSDSLGLGLAIARSIVELHGGTMGLSSRPGSGSTFYFTLPQLSDEGTQAEVSLVARSNT